jgi:hypothetical protein
MRVAADAVVSVERVGVHVCDGGQATFGKLSTTFCEKMQPRARRGMAVHAAGRFGVLSL